MRKVNIIGIGPGNELSMTRQAVQAIEYSSCLIGDKRMLKPFENNGKTIIYSTNYKEIRNYLKEQSGDDCAGTGQTSEVSILVSGDVGFYSLAKSFLEDDDGVGEITLICGISSLQYLCSKLKTPWDDVSTISLHGRDSQFMTEVQKNHKLFVLTDGKNTPAQICRKLCEAGLDSIEVSVGENLSYPDEKITTAQAREIAGMEFSVLSSMLIINHQMLTRQAVTHGLPDDLFIRGDVPMTKQEVRAVSISKLQLQSTDIVYDIGAGTGSAAVEMALQVSEGMVYALERKSEALELIGKNKEKFRTANLMIIPAFAPDGLDDLPSPHKVFIGGHGGNLDKILDIIFDKNPDVRVVINAITLETLSDAMNYFRHKTDMDVEIVNMTVSKSKKVGQNNLMLANNPINIITVQRNIKA